MKLWGALLVAAALPAQQPPGVGLVRGNLLECEATEFSIRSTTNHVYRFTFDAKTYIERDKQRITVSGLSKGDALEIVADRASGTGPRYARTIHVIERPVPARAALSQGRLRAYRSPIEHIMPRGALTFSGIILRLNDDSLLLRTRVDGEKTILLRQDTRFLDSGLAVEQSMLKTSTRVFVRAGKNLENEIEAYQVVWGDILEPKQ
jgi:hypothetical protein